MAQFFTDFTEYGTGALPSDWSRPWSTSAQVTATVESSGVPSGGGAQAFHVFRGSNTSQWAAVWDTAGTPSGDVEVLCKWYYAGGAGAPPDSLNHGKIAALHVSGSLASENAYFIQGTDNSSPFTERGLQKRVSASETSLSSYTRDLDDATWYWTRLQRAGTTLRVREWLDGSAEPGTWDSSVTDASLSSGAVGVICSQFFSNFWIDQFGVGTGGDPAPDGPLSSFLPRMTLMGVG